MHNPDPNAGWTTNRVDTRGQVTDESYQAIVGYHNPIWRYMILRYLKEASSPINVIGYTAIPLAIEFSQWGFPVTYITDNLQGVKKAKRDCEIHSGKFNNFYYFDFLKDCPNAKATIFIGIVDRLSDDEIFTFLDMLLRRSREVVFAVRKDRDWRNLLNSNYSVNVSEYNDNNFVLLAIKENV